MNPSDFNQDIKIGIRRELQEVQDLIVASEWIVRTEKIRTDLAQHEAWKAFLRDLHAVEQSAVARLISGSGDPHEDGKLRGEIRAYRHLRGAVTVSPEESAHITVELPRLRQREKELQAVLQPRTVP